MKEVIDVSLHLIPIIIGLVVAVVKIGAMIDKKLEAHSNTFTTAIGSLKDEVTRVTKDLWDSQTRQDNRFDALAKDHYRLEGRLGIKAGNTKGLPD